MKALVLAAAALAASLLAGGARADPPRSPLALAHDLLCAADEARARATLIELSASGANPLGLPVEAGVGAPRVRASTVDHLLHALHRAHERHPALRTRVEEIVLSFRYCDVFHGGEAWDLAQDGQALFRSRATPPPGGYRGFKAWGFLPEGRAERTVPTLLLQNPLGRGQREWFIGWAVLEGCFPHPTTGLLTFEGAEPGWTPPGVRSTEGAGPAEAAPTEPWSDVCAPPPAPPVPAPVSKAAKAPPRVEAPGPAVAVLAVPGQGAGAAPIATEESKLGLAGNGHFSVALRDLTPSAGVGLSWSPREFFYLRAGLDKRLNRASTLPTYSWGIGYNDWHPGTFSVEINNWAIPVDKVSLDTAALDVGYKIPMPKILENYLGAGVSMTMPFKAPFSFFGSFTVKPYGNFFLLAGVRLSPFVDPRVSWVYGFGYSDWHPFTLSLQYNNWGPNAVPKPNFIENGSITAAFSWAI